MSFLIGGSSGSSGSSGGNSHNTSTTTTKTTTTKTVIPVSNGPKKALCVGINNYPDPANRLMGCVNDATDWASYLNKTHGFSIQSLTDRMATARNFKNIAGSYITEAKAGDCIVITYSGHGSNVKDLNGDEQDGRDECICLYDRNFIDDEIRALFKQLHPEATLIFISDSCHSGTVTRSFLSAMDIKVVHGERLLPRYLPPVDDEEAANINLSKVKSRIFYPESGMNEILLSGCLPTEYSYDARINGRNNGAFSSIALQILKNNGPLTYNAFNTKVRGLLPSGRYPQTPQIEGSDENKNRLMF